MKSRIPITLCLVLTASVAATPMLAANFKDRCGTKQLSYEEMEAIQVQIEGARRPEERVRIW